LFVKDVEMAEVVSGGFDLKVANLLSSIVQVHCAVFVLSTVQEFRSLGSSVSTIHG